MKRGLKVKTGVRAPSVIEGETPDGFVHRMRVNVAANPDGTIPIVEGEMPLIRCVLSPPCGHCWYCAQHEARP